MVYVVLLCAGALCFSQTEHEPVPGNAAGTAATGSAVPDSFRGIQLGMPLHTVQGMLLSDPEFGYRGERDVSMLPGKTRTLVETAGTGILGRCWFQFYEDKLYILTVQLNTGKTDHYSVFSTLTEKYGAPVSLSPEKSVWRNDTVSLSLERPLSLKYILLPVFDALNGDSRQQDNYRLQQEKEFLDAL